MNTFIATGLNLAPADHKARNGELRHEPEVECPLAPAAPRAIDPETLRHFAWEIGERRAAEAYVPSVNHVALAAVSPYQGFIHWRLLPGWVEETARQRSEGWHDCRMVLRLYDVSFVEFNGLNAHHFFDLEIHSLCGQRFFSLPRPGTWQLAEVGFRASASRKLPNTAALSAPLL